MELSSWLKKCESIVKGLAPLTSFICGVMFPGQTAIAGVIGGIAGIIQSAEGIFGSGTGEKKAAYVTDAVKSAVGIMQGVSTGGQKETYDKLDKLVPTLANAIVAGINTYDDPSIDSIAEGTGIMISAATTIGQEFGWFNQNPI